MNFGGILLVVLALVYSAHGVHPLSGCSAGRAVPNAQELNGGTCGYGDWNSPTGPGSVFVAAVNEGFFKGGARCGECFELVGPTGSVVVTITDYCPSSSPKCGGDAVNFVLSTDAFNAIATNSTDIIYDLGFRQVSCSVDGDVGISFGQGSNQYYFSLLPYNARIAVSLIQVQGQGWSNWQSLVRQTDSSVWSWNKATNALTFPLSIQLTSENGQTITQTVQSIVSGADVSMGAQFDDVPAASEDCTMTPATPVIFESPADVGYGWDDSFSFKLISIDTASGPLHAQYGGYGGVQFVRDGGFETSFWSNLTFTVKASSEGYSDLRVYLSNNFENAVQVGPIGTSYQNITVSLASMNALPVEGSIVIQNNNPNEIELWFELVVLIRNETVPTDPAPLPSTTGITFTATSSAGGSTDSPSVPTGSSSSNPSSSGGRAGDSSESNDHTHSGVSSLAPFMGMTAALAACLYFF